MVLAGGGQLQAAGRPTGSIHSAPAEPADGGGVPAPGLAAPQQAAPAPQQVPRTSMYTSDIVMGMPVPSSSTRLMQLLSGLFL